MPQAWPLVPILPALVARIGGSPQQGEQYPSPTSRRATYMTYCAVCHGSDGRGNGMLAERLRVEPPDLTLLARRNKGTYPKELVSRIIDGREPVKGHGGPDMPVWGDAFKDSGEGFSEKKVRERIEGLVEFLKSIQVP
jgi:mono/diheme cytochrome c family protein